MLKLQSQKRNYKELVGFHTSDTGGKGKKGFHTPPSRK